MSSIRRSLIATVLMWCPLKVAKVLNYIFPTGIVVSLINNRYTGSLINPNSSPMELLNRLSPL